MKIIQKIDLILDYYLGLNRQDSDVLVRDNQLIGLICTCVNLDAKSVDESFYDWKWVLLHFIALHPTHSWSSVDYFWDEVIYVETEVGQVSFHGVPMEAWKHISKAGLDSRGRTWSGIPAQQFAHKLLGEYLELSSSFEDEEETLIREWRL